MNPFFAFIVPMGATPPDGGGGKPPSSPGVPTHPIYTPPGIWGPTDPRPTHPIVLPGDPPGIWGGGNAPMPTPPIVIPPDAIAPGVPTHPIYIPVYPAHPIVIPPGSIGDGVPSHPIVLPPYIPTHPIVIPPDAVEPGVPAHPIVLPPPTEPPSPGGEGWDWVYSPYYGWVVQPPGDGGKPQPAPVPPNGEGK